VAINPGPGEPVLNGFAAHKSTRNPADDSQKLVACNIDNFVCIAGIPCYARARTHEQNLAQAQISRQKNFQTSL
jgi:hypothetical protein